MFEKDITDDIYRLLEGATRDEPIRMMTNNGPILQWEILPIFVQDIINSIEEKDFTKAQWEELYES
jgi:hypothetical protein